jgi:hypothetical protein
VPTEASPDRGVGFERAMTGKKRRQAAALHTGGAGGNASIQGIATEAIDLT